MLALLAWTEITYVLALLAAVRRRTLLDTGLAA